MFSLISTPILTHTLNGDNGSVLLEFALVVPILLALALGTTEFGNVLRVDQNLAALAREGAQDAFRACAYDSAPQTCLLESYDRIKELADLALPNTEVVISMYRFVNGSTPFVPPRVVLQTIIGVDTASGPAQGETPLGNRSHFTPPPPRDIFSPVPAQYFPITLLQGDGALNDNGRLNQVVVTCEVFHRNEPLVKAKLDFFAASSSTRYENSIM